MSKKPRDKTVGPWAAEKLESLRACLDYYTTYLKNARYWEKIYVDAFAGPGLAQVRTKPQPPPGRKLDFFEDESDPVEEETVYR
jgi:hypothetical protein